MTAEDRRLLVILIFEINRLATKVCPICKHIGSHWEECSLKKNEDWVNEEICKLRYELE